jgi:hypothetical protein
VVAEVVCALTLLRESNSILPSSSNRFASRIISQHELRVLFWWL